jgi:hypothetical protein
MTAAKPERRDGGFGIAQTIQNTGIFSQSNQDKRSESQGKLSRGKVCPKTLKTKMFIFNIKKL